MIFCVHKHAASHLHFDFRLQFGKILKSWVLPKGPSLSTKVKRLAILTEDHAYSYRNFEGVISQGYGAGTVMLWDRGTYTCKTPFAEALKKGKIDFTLRGQKLRGTFSLIRMQGDRWLLIKNLDDYANKKIPNVNRSVKTNRTIAEITRQSV